MRPAPGMVRAAGMAAKALVARGVEALPVSPLAMLHACRDTRVYTLEEALEVEGFSPAQLESLFRLCDAVTFRVAQGGKDWHIVVFRADGNPARMRFTLAHELGHRVLHSRERAQTAEEEADCFASHLLCPEAVVRRIRQQAPDLSTAIERIATTCYVTRACARAAILRQRIPLTEPLAAAMESLADKAGENCRGKGE